MPHDRKLARAAGVLYLVTFVTSIPALVLKAPVLDHAGFVLGAGDVTGVRWAAWLEVVLALACIGTAVVLFPVVRRHSQPASVGFVASRVLEAALITVGVLALLAVVTLRQDAAPPDHRAAEVAGPGSIAVPDPGPETLVGSAAALVAVHDWSFLLGPGLLPAVNALCLASVLYRARLVPRAIPLAGLVGAPLLVASATATLFGITAQVSLASAVLALPIAAWESLGVWLVARGLRPPADGAGSAMSSVAP